MNDAQRGALPTHDFHLDSEDSMPAATRTPWARRGCQTRSTTFRIGVLFIVILTAAWRLLTMLQWSWFQDDWIYLTRTAELPFFDYLSQNYNGHLMLGQFALAWVITKVAPLDYSVAVVVTVAFCVGSILTWAAALRSIFGERARLLIAVFVLALSPLFMPISLWWAAAIQVFPLQLSMGMTLLFTSRYLLEGRQRRDLLRVMASYAFGLIFWQKSLLIAIPIGFLALMLAHGSFWGRLRQIRPLVVATAATAGAYLPLYLLLTREHDAARTSLFESRGIGESLKFFMQGILDVGLPGLLGGPWTGTDNPQAVYGTGSGARTLILLSLAVLVGVLALWMRRGAWLPMAMTCTYAFCSWGLLLTSSRFEVMGMLLVRDARYAADILPVALLASMVVITPTRSEGSSTWLKRPATLLTRPVVRGLTASSIGVVALSAIWGNGTAWDAAAPQSPKPWVDAMVADAKAAGEGTLYNSMAPNHVILSAFFWGDGRISQLLKPLHLPLRYDEPANPLLMVSPEGRLREVDVEEVSHNVRPVPVPGCGYLIRAGEMTLVPVTLPLYAWQWGIQIDYFTQSGGVVHIQSETEAIDVPMNGGGVSSVTLVIEDAIPALKITGAAGAGPVCVTEVRIGPLKASDRPVRPHE